MQKHNSWYIWNLLSDLFIPFLHLRRKGVKRSNKRFRVGGEEIKVMEEYNYLGCVVDEYLSNVRMVEERAKAGAKALSDWLRLTWRPFLLSSKFRVCGCVWYKLFSGKRCILGEGKCLGGKNVGLEYPAWLLRQSTRWANWSLGEYWNVASYQYYLLWLHPST